MVSHTHKHKIPIKIFYVCTLFRIGRYKQGRTHTHPFSKHAEEKNTSNRWTPNDKKLIWMNTGHKFFVVIVECFVSINIWNKFVFTFYISHFTFMFVLNGMQAIEIIVYADTWTLTYRNNGWIQMKLVFLVVIYRMMAVAI